MFVKFDNEDTFDDAVVSRVLKIKPDIKEPKLQQMQQRKEASLHNRRTKGI